MKRVSEHCQFGITLFLRSEIEPRLLRAVYFSIASIFVSFLLAAGVSNLALGPLKEISRNLDSVSSGTTEALSGDESEHDELGLVTLKIANLGRQMRDSKEIFSALKDNVDQLMSKLQDGLMLFTRDSQVVLVSAPVERFLGRPRGELLGRTAKDVFSGNTALGNTVLEAFERRRPLSGEFIAAAGIYDAVSPPPASGGKSNCVPRRITTHNLKISISSTSTSDKQLPASEGNGRARTMGCWRTTATRTTTINQQIISR